MTEGGPLAMTFTGERFVPEQSGDIALEHLHRYLLAGEMVAGREVLDIACGEGYGSAMLAATARRVIGVDVSREAVAHARRRYRGQNLDFKIGSCTEIPLPDASVDAIVSLETLEHFADHAQGLKEFRRVLRPGGLLIISTPDKYEYSVASGFANEYHVRELYRHEFVDLLARHFVHHRVLGQRVVYGSAILTDEDAGGAQRSFRWDGVSIETAAGIWHPLYLLGIASDHALPPVPTGLLEQPVDHSQVVHSWAARVSELTAECSRLGEVIASRGEDGLAAGFAQRERVLREELDEARDHLARRERILQEELEGVRASLWALSQQLAAARAEVELNAAEVGRLQARGRAQSAALEALATALGVRAEEASTLAVAALRLRQERSDAVQREYVAEARSRELEAQVASLGHALSQRDSALVSAREEVDTLRPELERRALELADAITQANELRAVVGVREARLLQVEPLALELHKVYRSTSWRVTRPIRLAKTAVIAVQEEAASALRAARRGASDGLLTIARRFYHRAPIPIATKWRLREWATPVITSLQDQSTSASKASASLPPSPAPSRRSSTVEEAMRVALAHLYPHCARFGPVSHVITLPFLASGGAEMTALSFARSVLEQRDHTSVLVLVTDRPIRAADLAVPDGALVLVADDLLGPCNTDDRLRFLESLVRAVRPLVLHNINSEAAWHLIVSRGDQLSRLTRLFASIFAFQFDGDGTTKIGYAAYFLQKAMPFLTGLLSDNRRFLDDAVREYGLVDDCSKLHVVYNAARVLGAVPDVRARLERLASRVPPLRPMNVVWAGRLDTEKRVDLLISVAEACPDVQFHVFGQSVLDKTVALPDTSNLHYRGPFSSPTEVLDTEGEFQAFMFTSRWEGMPNVLLEFGALGVPLVAPVVGGVGELVSEATGFPLPERPSVDDYRAAFAAISVDPVDAAGRASRLLELIESRHSRSSFDRAVRDVPGYLF